MPIVGMIAMDVGRNTYFQQLNASSKPNLAWEPTLMSSLVSEGSCGLELQFFEHVLPYVDPPSCP